MRPEDLQKLLNEMLGTKGGAAPPPRQVKREEEKPKEPFDFRFVPRQIKEYLDRFVIRQDEAKKVLSVALCDHYHHAQLARDGKALPNYSKQNILLLGPTGVGKTYLVRSLARLVGVPFVKADATKFTETGYVGGDVEDLVRELHRLADGDMERACFGIVYLDEIDKIASSSGTRVRDVSGRGVQTNLLRLMEDADVPVRSQQDIAGQFQMMMNPGGSDAPQHINTRHILFIVSGAFQGLEEIIRKRLDESTVGFASARTGNRGGDETKGSRWLDRVETPDLLSYGFEPEFIGRLPVRVACRSLDEEDLHAILKSSEGSIIRQYQADFRAYGIEMEYDDDALRRIAARAVAEETGARGLMTICERIFRNYKFELSGSTVTRLSVTGDLVEDPDAHLGALLGQDEDPLLRDIRRNIESFVVEFREQHGIDLRFSAEALLRLQQLCRGTCLSRFCREHFRDYQFGLRLIAQNTGRTSYELDLACVERPSERLSQWVVASYRDSRPEEGKSRGSG